MTPSSGLTKYFRPQGGILVAACHSAKVAEAQALVKRNGHGWCNLTESTGLLGMEEYNTALETYAQHASIVYIIADDKAELEETQRQAFREMVKKNIEVKVRTLQQYRDKHCGDSLHGLELGHGQQKSLWDVVFGGLGLFQYTCVPSTSSPTVSPRGELPEELAQKLQHTHLHFIFESWQEGTLSRLVSPDIPPHLETEEVELLAQAMPFMQTRTFHLPARLNQAQVQRILPNVFRQRLLKELDLRDVFLGKEGAKLLVHGLSGVKDPPLETLNLKSTNLEEAGARELQPALSKFQSLRELNLKGNSLHEVGMRILSVGIGNLRSLTRLDVSQNGIGEEIPQNGIGENGLDYLGSSLLELEALTDLILDYNDLSTGKIKELWDALHVHQAEAETRFTRFSFAGNGTPQDRQELVRQIGQRRFQKGNPLVAE